MQQIKTVFQFRGFTYTQLQREGLAALYEQCSPGGARAYEVVHIRVHPPGTIRGRSYLEREGYPNDEQWGRYGWTHRSLVEAGKAYARLVAHLRTQPEADDFGEQDDAAEEIGLITLAEP